MEPDRAEQEEGTVLVMAQDLRGILDEFRRGQIEDRTRENRAVHEALSKMTSALQAVNENLVSLAKRNEDDTRAIVNEAGPLLEMPRPISEEFISRGHTPANDGDNIPSETTAESRETTDPSLASLAWLLTAERTRATLPELPKFGKAEVTQPVQHLDRLEKYFLRLRVPDEAKLETALDTLHGDALHWSYVCRQNWSNYSQFTTDFLNHYWSEANQSQLRRKICAGRWDANKGTSMSAYFNYMIAQAQLLDPPLPEKILISEIIMHFPTNIQSLWETRMKKTIPELSIFLRSQEAILINNRERPRRGDPVTDFDSGRNNQIRSQAEPWRRDQGQSKRPNIKGVQTIRKHKALKVNPLTHSRVILRDGVKQPIEPMRFVPCSENRQQGN